MKEKDTASRNEQMLNSPVEVLGMTRMEPILIFGLGMGTAGAGAATGFSQFVSFCILLFMCNTHKDAIHITPRNYRPSLQIYGRILYTGVPSLARQGLFLIPVLAILPAVFGLRGLQLSQPVSDILAFFLAFVLTRGILKELDRKGKEKEELRQ